MRMSDLVAKYITEMLGNEQNSDAEIQRMNLLGEILVVPSQINYVITSRFTRTKFTLLKADEAAAVIKNKPCKYG